MKGNAQNAIDAVKGDLSKDTGVAATRQGMSPTVKSHAVIDGWSSTLSPTVAD
jgi:hypothetical protein